MPDGIPFAQADGYWRWNVQETDTRYGPTRTPAERREQLAAIRGLAGGAGRVVYAVRLPEGIIKIGCSTNLVNRLAAYGDCEILAFRPGTLDDEETIHKSLRPHLHHGREWYNPTPEVLAVVNDMRDHFRLPPIAA